MPNTVYIATVHRRNAPPAQIRFEKEDEAAAFIQGIEDQLLNKDGFIKFNRNGVYAKLRIEALDVFGYEPRQEFTEEEMKALHNSNSPMQGQVAAGYSNRSVLGSW